MKPTAGFFCRTVLPYLDQATRRAVRSVRLDMQVLCRACTVIAAIALWSATVGAGESPPPDVGAQAMEATLRHDAALSAVHFADGSHGWAVGDRGVIWHTHDGGTSWMPQSSGVSCRLSAVQFLDNRRGWAVGGESRPYSHATRGVVLRTGDGGASWTSIPNTSLPLLTGVKFFDANSGIVFGVGSTARPAGVYVTHDGGDSWQPLPGDDTGQWLAGDFLDREAGAVAGAAGRFATLARRQVLSSPLATPSLRSFRAMRLAPPAAGWVVGDGGLVMTTGDLGRSWRSPAGDLPAHASDHFDFHALAVHGSNVWIAGSPGTRVFHSADNGQTWQAFATNHMAPLRALAFVDAEHGWAVGDLGCILATNDGGRSWQAQRTGAQRAALLVVLAEATDVPLELLAQLGVVDGYIAAVELLHADRQLIDSSGAAAPPLRAREALLLAGAASADTAWRFPLPPDDLVLAPADIAAALNRANDGRAVEQLQSHLVRKLRMWRPEVVVTHHDQWASKEPLAAVMAQFLEKSVAAAADPAQFSELASDVGLPPWQVQRVYGLLPPGARGDEETLTGAFSARLGTSLADWSAPARELLSTVHSSPADRHELRMLYGLPVQAGGPRGLFSGIHIAYGSDARRPAAEFASDDSDDRRQMALRQQRLRKLLERSEGSAAWAVQAIALTDGLDVRGGGDLLFQLAEGYRTTGRLDLAADTYFLFARRYPDHPLVDRVLVWLVQFYASAEAAQSLARDQSTNVRFSDAAAIDRVDALAPTGREAVAGVPADTANVVQPAAATAPLAQQSLPAVSLSRDDRLRRAVQLAGYLASARVELYGEPELRFAEVAAQRRLGLPGEAKRYFLSLGQLPESNDWRRCAAAEQWLAEPGDTPPAKPLAACRRSIARPHLDGRLDEPLWESSDALRLHGESADAAESARGQIRLAYDDEFLYLAVTCPKVGGDTYPPDHQPRPRDADLAQHDRVAVRIDVDRDYSTAFELTLDHRGWCHDACWGDAHWNPAWYIAAASDAATWSVEAAVPLAELTDQPPAAKHVWAVGVRRTIPRFGYESWAGAPEVSDSPDQFGLLIFE